MEQEPRLWFEVFYRGHGIPRIVWALVAFLPFLVLYLLGYLVAGIPSGQYLPALLGAVPFYVIINVYLQYASRYASSRISGLAEEWHLVEKHSISLEPLFGLRGPTIISLVVYAILIPLFDKDLLRQGYTLFQVILTGVIPWLYYAYYFGTFFWMLGYSAYTLNKMGKLPLELKHFSEDRTLGLRDFGSTSLRLAGLFVLFIALFVIPNTIGGFVDLSFLLVYIGLMLIAIPLFLVPLLGLHSKLVSEKRKIVGQFAPAYKRLVQTLEANGAVGPDERLSSQLSATRQVIQEAGQIHSWPFDTGIIVRLSAIVISVVAILLSRVLAEIFKL